MNRSESTGDADGPIRESRGKRLQAFLTSSRKNFIQESDTVRLGRNFYAFRSIRRFVRFRWIDRYREAAEAMIQGRLKISYPIRLINYEKIGISDIPSRCIPDCITPATLCLLTTVFAAFAPSRS